MPRKPLLVLDVNKLTDRQKLALYRLGYDVGACWLPEFSYRVSEDAGSPSAYQARASSWMR